MQLAEEGKKVAEAKQQIASLEAKQHELEAKNLALESKIKSHQESYKELQLKNNQNNQQYRASFDTIQKRLAQEEKAKVDLQTELKALQEDKEKLVQETAKLQDQLKQADERIAEYSEAPNLKEELAQYH